MAQRIGRSDAYVDWHWLHKPPKRMMFLRKMKATVIYRSRAMMGDAVQSFENRFREASFLGYYEEYARRMRNQRKHQRHNA